MRALAVAAMLMLGACQAGDGDNRTIEAAARAMTTVTIATAQGVRTFRVETARTQAEQQRGLMFRTNISRDGGMLFAPYPPEGGPARDANFWMKDTPSPLDILYIRADGSIARIAENTVPFSEAPIPSGEPVSAVLEINGGRAAELGIAEGDTVRWTAP